MENESRIRKELPENARKPLEPGEQYVPMVPGDVSIPEVTSRSVGLGLVFCAVFSMAAAYLALKVGQGIEAAIPISILAIGLSQFFSRRSTILENVFVQSIGANSSHVVAGAVFTIPALYMLDMDPTWYQVILTAFLGGSLGILFIIPLRHHFMIEQHGQLPWPEATATTEILVSGEKVGGQARVLVISAGIAAIYEALVLTFGAFRELITFHSVYLGKWLADRFMTLRIDNLSAIVGLGYIVGIRYAAIICAGSFLSYFVLIPMVHAIGMHVPEILAPGTKPIAQMGIDEVFTAYVKIIGIGGIAGAGIMGVISAFPSMISSMTQGLKGLGDQPGETVRGNLRTDSTLSIKATFVGVGAVLVASFLFFTFGIGIVKSVLYSLVGVGLLTVIAFLFAPVAARAIALIGTNPVSGMTLLTLIVTGLIMKQIGLTGRPGMFVVMIIGGVVCTSLCASGAFASDLKIGHWIGANPKWQMLLKFVGTLVAAAFCGLAMWLLSGKGFGTAELPAPQATAMKEILVGIMGTQSAPLQWYLFALGVILSVILRMANVPALAFALGMYLPIQLNVPIFIGGFLSWLVQRTGSKVDEALCKARQDKGILIASGFIAGGAIMGVLDAVLSAVIGSEAKAGLHGFLYPEGALETTGEIVGILALIALCSFVVIYARRAHVEIDAAD